jgi:hypothetical protein
MSAPFQSPRAITLRDVYGTIGVEAGGFSLGCPMAIGFCGCDMQRGIHLGEHVQESLRVLDAEAHHPTGRTIDTVAEIAERSVGDDHQFAVTGQRQGTLVVELAVDDAVGGQHDAGEARVFLGEV